MRSFQSFPKYVAHSSSSACRASSVATTPSGPGIVVATSDQRVSLRRSSQGKSNSTASIWVVSSIETLSTQSNTSFFGRLSRHSAERCGRREHRMVCLDVHDVVVFCHRPVRPEHAVLAIMDRVFLAKPIEIGPERIAAKQFGIAGIKLLKRNRIGSLPSGFLIGILNEINRPMHRATPCLFPPWLIPEALASNYIPLRVAGQGRV